MKALGVDTSNYATSLAVVDVSRKEVVCSKKVFLPVEQGGLGLRQSDAVFHHTAALPRMMEELLRKGALSGVAAVCASARPRPVDGSYMPCFLAGVSFATAFAAALGAPPVLVSHQEGHVRAAIFGAAQADPACEEAAMLRQKLLVFHLSGGTTELLLAQGCKILATVGKSMDLFAGQAVDRLGVRLGYAFPAGAAVSELAARCVEDIRPKISTDGANCHLSGLQNQCERLLEAGKTPEYTAKYCLLAIADTMAAMIAAARAQHGALPVLCAGGVACSDIVRQRLLENVENILFAPAEYSADNAVGVALLGAERGGQGEGGVPNG